MNEDTFYAGPTANVVVDRLLDAGVDEDLVRAYIREEHRRGNPVSPLAARRITRAISAIRRYLASAVAAEQDDYTLAGPSKE